METPRAEGRGPASGSSLAPAPTRSFRFSVPGVPVAQPRQRTRVIASDGAKAYAQNYTSKRDPVNAWKAAIAGAWSRFGGGLLIIDGPIRVELVLVFPRPAGKVWKRRPMPRLRKASRPDAENVAKAALDALTGLAWTNDAQVSDLHVVKRIAAGGEAASTLVIITPLDEEL